MIKAILRKTFVVFICHALAYAPLISAAQLSLPSGDLIAPEITQLKYTDTVGIGKSHAVSVNVTDNTAVKQVTLYYRVIGTEKYQRKSMKNKENTDIYQTTIKADEIKKPGIEYYIQAMDTNGNTLLHGHSFSPLSVKTVDDGAILAGSTTGSESAASGATEAAASAEGDSIFTNKWFWIGVGVLALGAAAAGGGSSSSGGGGTPTTATLTINAAEPVN